jgi:hypothetical protein
LKLFFSILLTLFVVTDIAQAQSSTTRVPRVFTGSSPDFFYQNYAPYNKINDARDSREYAEYFLDAELVEEMANAGTIQSVHVHVRNIAKDNMCSSSECFRAFVFVNGDEDTGVHVATFVVSPGTGSKTPTMSDKPLRVYDSNVRYLTKFEKPTKFDNWDMYRIYGSKSYPGSVPNMPNAMFVLPAIAIHGSFDTVDGNKRSHGCVRMFPDESYWLHSLVISAEGQMTMDILHTK